MFIRGSFLLRPCGFCFYTSFPRSHRVRRAGVRRRPPQRGAWVGACWVSVPVPESRRVHRLLPQPPGSPATVPRRKLLCQFLVCFLGNKKKGGIFSIFPSTFISIDLSIMLEKNVTRPFSPHFAPHCRECCKCWLNVLWPLGTYTRLLLIFPSFIVM